MVIQVLRVVGYKFHHQQRGRFFSLLWGGSILVEILLDHHSLIKATAVFRGGQFNAPHLSNDCHISASKAAGC